MLQENEIKPWRANSVFFSYFEMAPWICNISSHGTHQLISIELHVLHPSTQSAKAMLLKSLPTQRYDFQNEASWSSQSRDLMVCSLALDPRFKHFAVQLLVSREARIMCHGGELSRMQHCVIESLRRAALRKSQSQQFEHQSGHELASSMLFMHLLK
jgi:hypothetical protein